MQISLLYMNYCSLWWWGWLKALDKVKIGRVSRHHRCHLHVIHTSWDLWSYIMSVPHLYSLTALSTPALPKWFHIVQSSPTLTHTSIRARSDVSVPTLQLANSHHPFASSPSYLVSSLYIWEFTKWYWWDDWGGKKLWRRDRQWNLVSR